VLRCLWVALRASGALLFPLFLFKPRKDELMHFVAPDKKMALAEFAVHVIAGIRMPNELHNLHEERTVSPERRITGFEESERSPTHARVRRAQHVADVSS
jgi:hypothetical protein